MVHRMIVGTCVTIVQISLSHVFLPSQSPLSNPVVDDTRQVMWRREERCGGAGKGSKKTVLSRKNYQRQLDAFRAMLCRMYRAAVYLPPIL